MFLIITNEICHLEIHIITALKNLAPLIEKIMLKYVLPSF